MLQGLNSGIFEELCARIVVAASLTAFKCDAGIVAGDRLLGGTGLHQFISSEGSAFTIFIVSRETVITL